MHSSVLRGRRGRLAGRTLAGSVLLVCVLLAAAACTGPRYERRGTLHCVIEGNDLYTFDPVWRIETLRQVEPDTGISREEAGQATSPRMEEARVRMRTRLLRELGVTSLDGIPVEGAAERQAIRALGYF